MSRQRSVVPEGPGVRGDVDRVLAQRGERHDLQRALVGRGENDEAAAPSWCARSQFAAVTHHRSPGISPGNMNCGIGVVRSLPMRRW